MVVSDTSENLMVLDPTVPLSPTLWFALTESNLATPLEVVMVAVLKTSASAELI